jgi:glycosyltransferase involved in cell wall biosynthesis
MKVALLTNVPAPYRISFYEAWSRIDDVVVIYDRLSASSRAWKVDLDGRAFRYVLANSFKISYASPSKDLNFCERRDLHISLGIFGALSKERPDVVVSAEFGARSLFAWLWCLSHSTPLIITNEGTPHTERNAGVFRKLFRKLIVPKAIRHWSNGRDSTQCLVHYGATSESTQEGMTGVDTRFFLEAVAKRAPSRDEIRSKWGAQGLVFLVLGTLSLLKGMVQLREAVNRLVARGNGPTCTIILLGSGEEMEAMKAWAACLPAWIRVVFPGFVQIEDVPEFLVAADYGLLPTLQDCWPLATLEMLLAGLPQLFSVKSGSTAELCEEGVTGHSFDPVDIEAFANLLGKTLENPLPRLSPEVVEKYAQQFSPEAQAARASSSVRSAAEAFRS